MNERMRAFAARWVLGAIMVAGAMGVGASAAVADEVAPSPTATDAATTTDETSARAAPALAAPVLTHPEAGADTFWGDNIFGTAAGADHVLVSVDGADPFGVAVDSGSYWGFPVPGLVGTIHIEVVAVAGDEQSAPLVFDLDVADQQYTLQPYFAYPSPFQVSEEQQTLIVGTGLPGATVELTGSATGTTVVNGDGTWSIEIPPMYGYLQFAATAKAPGHAVSVPNYLAFTNVPPATPTPTPTPVVDTTTGGGTGAGADAGSLAATGADPWPLLVAGGGALIVAAGALGVSRRIRRA